MIAYELATGKPAFDPKMPPGKLMFAIIGGKLPKIPSTVNPALMQVIERGWATDPARRPTMAQICEILTSVNWCVFPGADATKVAEAELELPVEGTTSLRIRKLEDEIAALKTEVSTLKAENATLKSENGQIPALESEVSALEAENTTLQSENTTLKSENTDLKSENASLKDKTARLEAEIARDDSPEHLPQWVPEVSEGPISIDDPVYWPSQGPPPSFQVVPPQFGSEPGEGFGPPFYAPSTPPFELAPPGAGAGSFVLGFGPASLYTPPPYGQQYPPPFGQPGPPFAQQPNWFAQQPSAFVPDSSPPRPVFTPVPQASTIAPAALPAKPAATAQAPVPPVQKPSGAIAPGTLLAAHAKAMKSIKIKITDAELLLRKGKGGWDFGEFESTVVDKSPVLVIVERSPRDVTGGLAMVPFRRSGFIADPSGVSCVFSLRPKAARYRLEDKDKALQLGSVGFDFGYECLRIWHDGDMKRDECTYAVPSGWATGGFVPFTRFEVWHVAL